MSLDNDTRPDIAPTDSIEPSTPVQVRVAVHNGHCGHYGICAQEAPEVFALRGEHRLSYDATPDPDSAARVRHAARLCPMQAITVTPR